MTAFTEIEQEVTDLSWYAVDTGGRIGHFTTGGFQLLPPIFSRNKEILEKLHNYFTNILKISEQSYSVCPTLERKREELFITEVCDYIKPSAEMSKKGLYSYDSPPITRERPYFRVTLPKEKLYLRDLPEEIRELLERYKIEADFTEDTLISEQIISKL